MGVNIPAPQAFERLLDGANRLRGLRRAADNRITFPEIHLRRGVDINWAGHHEAPVAQHPLRQLPAGAWRGRDARGEGRADCAVVCVHVVRPEA